MPNFDGNGPLKRGRVIGRGRGPCNKTTEPCGRADGELDTRSRNVKAAQ